MKAVLERAKALLLLRDPAAVFRLGHRFSSAALVQSGICGIGKRGLRDHKEFLSQSTGMSLNEQLQFLPAVAPYRSMMQVCCI